MVDHQQFALDDPSIVMSSSDLSMVSFAIFSPACLVNEFCPDPIFQASQDLASNTRLIDSAEATVRACEQELQVLRTIGLDTGHWWSGATAMGIRTKYLMDKMANAQGTLEKLEKHNGELKKVLARGG
jgi:hypothetical protein